MNRNTLVSEIKARLGNPPETALSTDTINFSIDAALDELSRLQPFYIYHTINLTQGNSVYAVEDDIIDVRGVWFTSQRMYRMGMTMEDFNLLGDTAMPAAHQHGEYAGLKVFHSPSLMNVIEEKWERLRARQVQAWEFNPDTGELMVLPTPKRNGIAIYKGVIKRDLSTVGSKYISPFKDLARAISMESWGYKTSGIKSIPIGVGKVDYEVGSLIKTASKLKEEALRKLMGGGSGAVIG